MPFWEDIPPTPRVGHEVCGKVIHPCPFCGTLIMYARMNNEDLEPGRVMVFCKPQDSTAVRGKGFVVRLGVAKYWGYAGGEWALHRCQAQTEVIEKMKTGYVKLTAQQYLHLNINAPARTEEEPLPVEDLLERKRREQSPAFHMETTL